MTDFMCCGVGERDLAERGERAAGEVPGDDLRRRAWPVPRPDGAVQDRRALPRHQLPVHGGLRGPRLLLGGDSDPARMPQSALQGPHHHPQRQS